jgi:hypothetical protein
MPSAIVALDQALKAREILNESLPEDKKLKISLYQFLLHNRDLMSNIEDTAYRCLHCNYLTEGVKTIGHD